MKSLRLLGTSLLVLLAIPVAVLGRCSIQEGSSRASSGQTDDSEVIGPHPEPVDLFHPERERAVTPAYGGTVTVHIESMPRTGINNALENSWVARNILNELHAWLVRRDWENWKLEPELATGWEVADTLVRKDGLTMYGAVREDADRYHVKLLPPSTPGAPFEMFFSKEMVQDVERGTVYTFHLREGVRWHDGHPFDANDVHFSWRIAANPLVRCDWCRPYLQKIERAEVLDAHTIRFFFREQYFNSLNAFADNLCILPAHLFDLLDPDHPRHDPRASPEAQAREINENPGNTRWIGLGPYRLTSFSQEAIEAERFDGYYDPEQSGYIDRIRWRHIPGDDAAFQALVNGELDFTTRITSDQYFGPAIRQEAFTRRFYAGHFYIGAFNYVPWNLRRPILSDLRVRKALAHAMDLGGFVSTVLHGLAKLPTGQQCYFGPAYNHDVKPLPFDLERSAELFTEAGWYDRDGDGLIDKDGLPFEFQMLIVSGNKPAELFAQMYQESLARVGVRLNTTPVDWATYSSRVNGRDFDAGNAGWAVDVIENDPVQLWHSSAAAKGGSNHPGVMDPHVDELIARGDRELDDEKRWAIWRELHRYLYEEVQPYLFREMPPRKFALNQALRGVQFFKINPGYSVRRWFYPAGTPGTRATREKE